MGEAGGGDKVGGGEEVGEEEEEHQAREEEEGGGEEGALQVGAKGAVRGIPCDGGKHAHTDCCRHKRLDINSVEADDEVDDEDGGDGDDGVVVEEGGHNGEGGHTEDGVGQDKQKCFKCLAPIVFFSKVIGDLVISSPLAKA